MKDYDAIQKYIREAQLQRSVALAEIIANGLVWFFKGIDRVSSRVASAVSRKPGPAKTAAQH